MAWTDERIDDAFSALRSEMREMREEMREMRAEMNAMGRELRSEIAAVRREMHVGALALMGTWAAALAVLAVNAS